MLIILLTLLACRQSVQEPKAPPVQGPTVVSCTQGTVMSVPSQGPVWGVSVVLPSGVRVAPMIRVFSDQVDVYCPPEGGVTTVEWGD